MAPVLSKHSRQLSLSFNISYTYKIKNIIYKAVLLLPYTGMENSFQMLLSHFIVSRVETVFFFPFSELRGFWNNSDLAEAFPSPSFSNTADQVNGQAVDSCVASWSQAYLFWKGHHSL